MVRRGCVYGLAIGVLHVAGCQNYGPFLGTLNNYNRDPKRDPNFDNHPCMYAWEAREVPRRPWE